jgi:hypothetical protein
MRKRLQIALMASTVAAISFSLNLQLRAADGSDSESAPITASEDHGRTVYVNDFTTSSPAKHPQSSETPRRTLMYWPMRLR